MSDRVIVMRGGKVVETGTAQQMFEAPREDYTKALLRRGAAPRSQPRWTRSGNEPQLAVRRPPANVAESWASAFAEIAPEIDVRTHRAGAGSVRHSLLPDLEGRARRCGRDDRASRSSSASAPASNACSPIPSLPRDVPLVRMVEPELTRGMVEYVLWQCLFHHRRSGSWRRRRAAATWRPHTYPAPWERTIGIMGLGELGAAAAAKLVEFGFKVRGWSRSPKSLREVESFHGARSAAGVPRRSRNPGLPAAADAGDARHPQRSAVRAPAARRQRDQRGARRAPGRSGPVGGDGVGQIAAATLDVFETEPLPADHPFWSTERLYITPHNASDHRPPLRRLAHLQADREDSRRAKRWRTSSIASAGIASALKNHGSNPLPRTSGEAYGVGGGMGSARAQSCALGARTTLHPRPCPQLGRRGFSFGGRFAPAGASASAASAASAAAGAARPWAR